MLFRDTIKLISITNTTNDIGDPVQTKTKTADIFADKQSVRQNEFYQAMATGLKPELMFVIREIDYNQEPMLEYNSKEYNIIRTYSKDSELIELVCEGVVNGVL
jgi:SPP1 family predicted phage head-tail adaptor